jgi:hypothetical protein
MDRYLALAQHDSYWFANIIDRGYGTIVPPTDHREMEVSNVAFFPAFPLLATALKRSTGLDTCAALLITAQMATVGFWTYFFLFGVRWKLSVSLQIFGALAIATHPAAFYLVAGYSESLFLLSLVGFIYWCTSARRGAAGWAVVHGIVMTATRIVGLPCAGFPVVHAVLQDGWRSGERIRDWVRRYRKPVLLMMLSMTGGVAFFVYCQIRWGRWDLYMQTQAAGWGIDPDYLAVFRPTTYRFDFPSLYDSSGASQLTTALAGVLFIVIGLVESITALRRRTQWRQRASLYIAAAVVYYISLAGVATVELESMLRYDLCVHALIVLAALHFLREVRPHSLYVRATAMALAGLVFAAGLSLQGFYVSNFTQGNWVA